MINEYFVLEIRDLDNFDIIQGYYNGPDKSNYDSFLLSKSINDSFFFDDKKEAIRIAEHFSEHGKKILIVTVNKYKNVTLNDIIIKESLPDGQGYINSQMCYRGISIEDYGNSFNSREQKIFKNTVEIFLKKQKMN